MSARDEIHRVRSVRLVPTDEPAYLAAMAEQALAHRHFGPKEEQSATYRASGRVEAAAREWLAQRVPLLADRVVAAEVLYRDARSYSPLFLELDAVQGRHGIPTCVYEVKFTSNTGAVAKAYGQLARAIGLLESRYERVAGVVVVVHADRGAFDPGDPRLAEATIVTGEDLLAPSLPGRPLLHLDLADLATFLSDEDLALVQEARDEGDANVAARQERAVRVEAGEEPPPRPPRARREGAVLAFTGTDGDDAEADSPFAVLRGLSVREGREGPTGEGT